MIGQTISHYNIIEKLGEGGMGVVYKAHDTKLKRDVAIKFLPHHIAASDEQRERFKVEAQAAASLNHPNIGTVYAIEEFGDEVFIAMEYVEGQELKQRIAQGPLALDESIAIAIQIAEGLQAAHNKEIVHRDIKSANIMLTEKGNVKIMDFGLAKMRGGSQLTKLGTTVGTAAYMSPEQARGEDVDQRTDIWSFGVVLYEMLTGRLPFKSEYEQALIYSILNEEPEPMAGVAPKVEQVVKKALAKNPDDRYQTAGELADELRTTGEGGSTKTVVRHSKLPWMIGGAMAILVAVAFFLFMPSTDNVKEKDAVQTIAVLPFIDMSQNKDQEYFSDGLAEELLNVLAKNPKLRVTSRTSSFSFRGKDVDIKTIAAKLNVKHILEGSVRKSGNTLRITAQLIDVETDAHLWSDTYDGTLENIFAVQDTISRSVAEALKITLLGKGTATLQKQTDPEAYNAYLLGKHFFNLFDKENLKKAVGYFEKALSIDPGYAPARVSLSGVYMAQADRSYIQVDEGYRKARQEAVRALELDPNLAAAYSQMGLIKQSYVWDFRGANELYQRGLELEPGNIAVLRGAASLAATLGRFDEAILLTRRTIEFDPVRTSGYYNLGFFAYCAGMLDLSGTAFRKALDLNPQFPVTHLFLGRVYLEKGKPDSALAEMMRETEPDWQLFGLALAYHSLGKDKEADLHLARLIEEFNNGSAYQIAEIYAYRGETDKAFEWLERAYVQRDGGLTNMKGDPLLRNIEKDSRYAEFMKKMKLPL